MSEENKNLPAEENITPSAEEKICAEELACLTKKVQEYDAIRDVYGEILEYCQKDGKSVPQFVKELKNAKEAARLEELTEKCGGNTDLAEHIITLEQEVKGAKNELDEIRKYFPKIKSAEQLPLSVTERARLRGTMLLDEYLRYLLEEDARAKASVKEQQISARASTGSQTNRKSEINPEAAEFLRGLWK